MARDKPKDDTKVGEKLRKLPDSAKVSKRPLMHPPIPSPHRGRETQKVIYIGSKTPFMSAFKRVKALLKQVDKRAMQSELHQARRRGRNVPPQAQSADGAGAEEVVVKATGKAIDKAVSLALALQNQSDLKVKIGTSSTQAIDDIEAGDDDGAAGAGEDEELPESRLRGVSVLEIAVSLR